MGIQPRRAGVAKADRVHDAKGATMPEPIPSTLDDQARTTTANALQATLVDLIDLSLVAKQAHWNLIGRQFHDVHLHLDELVDTSRKYSDEVAERMSAIGVSPDGRTAPRAG
jgi:starvation-inducible DNA-binding protein